VDTIFTVYFLQPFLHFCRTLGTTADIHSQNTSLQKRERERERKKPVKLKSNTERWESEDVEKLPEEAQGFLPSKLLKKRAVFSSPHLFYSSRR
jgi:hypothetical protein